MHCDECMLYVHSTGQTIWDFQRKYFITVFNMCLNFIKDEIFMHGFYEKGIQYLEIVITHESNGFILFHMKRKDFMQ